MNSSSLGTIDVSPHALADAGTGVPVVLPTAAPPTHALSATPPTEAAAASGSDDGDDDYKMGNSTDGLPAAAAGNEGQAAQPPMELDDSRVVRVFAFPRSLKDDALPLPQLDGNATGAELLAEVADWLDISQCKLLLLDCECNVLDPRLTLECLGFRTDQDSRPPLAFVVPILAGQCGQSLGDGGNGTVYAGHVWSSHGQQVEAAIKTFAALPEHPHLGLQSRHIPEDFRQLVQVIAGGYVRNLAAELLDLRPPPCLACPWALVQVEEDRRLGVAMPRCSKDAMQAILARLGPQTVADFAALRGTRWPIDLARKVLTAQLDTSLWMASRGFVHADHKPSNAFLVDEDGNRVVVGDLGGVRKWRPSTKAAMTPHYAAPEQCRSPRCYDPFLADCFTIGITAAVIAFVDLQPLRHGHTAAELASRLGMRMASLLNLEPSRRLPSPRRQTEGQPLTRQEDEQVRREILNAVVGSPSNAV